MNKIKGLISIARKAGYVIIGKDNLMDYKKKLYLLIVDNTAGDSLKREMKFISNSKKIPLLELDDLGEKVSIDNCKAIGLKNKAMSDSIEKCIKGE